MSSPPDRVPTHRMPIDDLIEKGNGEFVLSLNEKDVVMSAQISRLLCSRRVVSRQLHHLRAVSENA